MKKGIWIIIIIVLVGGYFLIKNPVASDAPGDAMEGAKKTMPMEPGAAPELTDAQKAALEAGKASHEPMALSFDVNGGNFYFSPNEIHVKKGDTVTINFKNDGGFHDFKIDEFNAATDRSQDGQIKSVTFVADKTGTFEYYCSVGSHRAMGMKGSLIVE